MRVGSQLKPAILRFIHGLMCTGVTVFLNNFVSVDYLMNDEFGMQPFWWRCVYLPLAMHVQTTTLFTGFIFSESNLVACG